MSRRTRPRKPGQAVAAARVRNHPQAELVHESEPAVHAGGPSRSRPLFAIAALLTTLWLLALMLLAMFTANPVTLNRRQIEAADVVVSARVLDRASGQIVVETVWTGGDVPERLRVDQLASTPAVNGRSYLLPLSRSAPQHFSITMPPTRDDRLREGTATRRSRGRASIYPATAEAIAQLREILSRPSPAR